MIGLRRTVKDAALAALTGVSGLPAMERNAARAKIAQLTPPVKAQAIELAVVRGKAGWD